MMTSSMYPSKSQEMNATNSWAFVVVLTLLGFAIVAVLSYVFTRNVTMSHDALYNMHVQHQKLSRLEMLVSTMRCGVATVDVDTAVIVECNEGFRTLTGRPSSELVGHSILDLVPREYQAEHRAMLLGDVETTWKRYGQEAFTLPSVSITHPDGTVVVCDVKVKGTRIDGRREWLLLIDKAGDCSVAPKDPGLSRPLGRGAAGSVLVDHLEN